MSNGDTPPSRATRPRRGLAIVLAAVIVLWVASASPSAAQPAGGPADAPPTTAVPAGSSPNVETVTTTESKLRWVVGGLVSIAVVTAAGTLLFAYHTSPRRRAAAAAAREAARAERLAAAAALAELGTGRSVREQAQADEPATRRVQPPVAAGAAQQRSRPDPRPRPRKRSD